MSHPLSEALRAAMRRFATGVTVVTAKHGERRAGMTVSAFLSVSLEPPTVLVSLHEGAGTLALAKASGAFAVSILGEDAGGVSARFAAPWSADGVDPFQSVLVSERATGAPVLSEAISWVDCRVEGLVPAGTHVLVLGRVAAAGTSEGASPPLLYYDRAYRRLAAAGA